MVQFGVKATGENMYKWKKTIFNRNLVTLIRSGFGMGCFPKVS